MVHPVSLFAYPIMGERWCTPGTGHQSVTANTYRCVKNALALLLNNMASSFAEGKVCETCALATVLVQQV